VYACCCTDGPGVVRMNYDVCVCVAVCDCSNVFLLLCVVCVSVSAFGDVYMCMYGNIYIFGMYLFTYMCDTQRKRGESRVCECVCVCCRFINMCINLFFYTYSNTHIIHLNIAIHVNIHIYV